MTPCRAVADERARTRDPNAVRRTTHIVGRVIKFILLMRIDRLAQAGAPPATQAFPERPLWAGKAVPGRNIRLLGGRPPLAITVDRSLLILPQPSRDVIATIHSTPTTAWISLKPFFVLLLMLLISVRLAVCF